MPVLEVASEKEQFGKLQPPVCPHPFERLSFCLLPWYIEDPDHPKCPSRCCKRLDFCCFHRCCGNIIVRHLLIAFAAVFIFWILWCIGVGIALQSLSPQLTVRSIEAVDPCSSDMGLVTKFDLSSDSWISGELREVTATMHFSPDSEAFASLTFSSDEQSLLHATGILQSESVSLQSGAHSMDMMLHLQSLNLPLSALFVAQVMNNTITPLHVKASVTVHTSAIWFPMTISHDITSDFVFNQPKVGPTAPSPKILAVEVDSDASLADVNKSAAVFTWFTMFLNASSIAILAPLPDLFVDVVHEGVEIATAHVNPVYVSPIFNMSLDVAIDLNLTEQQTVSIQNLVNYFTNGQNLSIQVRGSGYGDRQLPSASEFPVAPFPLNYTSKRSSSVFSTPLLPAGPTCFLQRVLDAMPLVTIPVTAKLPCPIPTKGTPPSNATNFTQANPAGCLPTEWQGAEMAVTKQDSVIRPTRMDLQRVQRNDSSPTYAQAYMEANITLGFSLYGRFTDMFFDLRSAGQNLGYIKIESFRLLPNQPTWKGNVSWTTLNESLIAQRIINFKDINALDLQLQGRPHENSFSDILFGVNTNVTSNSDNTTANASTGAAAYVAINDNPVNVSLGLGVQASFLPFDINIPQITVGIMNDNATIAEVISPQAQTLQYNAAGFVYANLLQMVCDVNMADNTGDFISSLLNDEIVNMVFQGTSTQQQLPTPAVIDFQISFSRSQLLPTSGGGGKSAFGLGVEVTKLFRNDSVMTLGWLTNVSWDLPINITGTFPQIHIDLKVEPPYNGSAMTETVADLTLESFALSGNAADTSLGINVLNQSLAAKLCFKADAFNLTIATTSTGNVVSRIISRLGFTITVPRKDGTLANTALGAIKKLQPSSDLYDIAIDSTTAYLRTSAFLNLSSSTIPIDLIVPAMHLSLQTAANAAAPLQEMSTLDVDSATFSSDAATGAQRKRLGVWQALASHAPVLGNFLNDLANFRNVTFGVAGNSSSQVAFDFRYDAFNLQSFLDLIATPNPGGWLSIPGLSCNDTAQAQSQWVWANTNDQWIVSCPAACASTVISTGGLYDWTSSVCTAAYREGALSSCGGKVLVTIETPTSFSIDKFVSRSLWPLKSLEPLSALRNLSTFQASAGAVIASLGIPLAGNLPEIQLAVSQNASELLRAQISSFVIPAIGTDLNLTLSTTIFEQQPLINVISNAKTNGTNLTISGVGGAHVLNTIASLISYELSLAPVNASALSLFPSVWPLVTFDIDSDNTSASVTVSTEFTPDFNAGFDIYVGAFSANIAIGQLQKLSDAWTPTGTVQVSELMLRDNACSNLSASLTLRIPNGQPSFLTSVMQQYFHGYDLNSSFQGSLSSRNFGLQVLSVNASLPPPVSASPPAETDHRCLCEPVWEDQGHLFFGECARTVTYPNGYCKIQNGSCYLTPTNPTYDACTQQASRTYYGCECRATWSYGTTQYTDGGCHNPDGSAQAWCPVIPGSCFGDTFTSAYIPFPNTRFTLGTGVRYRCATFYSQAFTEAACEEDSACFGYIYAPQDPLQWCLVSAPGNLEANALTTWYLRRPGASFRSRDVCSNPNVEVAKQSVALNSVHLLGSGSGNKVLLPCLLPGTFCPYESAGLNASSMEIMVNFSLATALPLQVNLRSNLDVVLQGYGLTPLFSVKVRALNFSSETFVNLVLLISPLDLPLSQTIVKDITHGKNNVDIGIAGNTGPGVTVLSSMFSRIGMKMTFFKYAVDSNGYILDADKSYNFSYWLSATTSDSATVSVATPLKNPVNVTWNLGQVSIRAWYALQAGGKPPVVVATSSFPFALAPGLNNMLVSATIVSEPSLNVCAGYPRAVSPPTFCAANEILSRVLSKTATAGIPLRLEMNTTNIFGQTITLEVDLAIMSVDNTPTRSKVLTPSTIYLIEDYSFNFLNTAWSSLSSASITLDMTIVLHNPFNITIKATELDLTLSLRDWEGGKIDNSAVAFVIGQQTVPPADNMFLLNHAYSNAGGVTVGYLGSQPVAVSGIQVSGMTSDVAVHLYDNYMEKDRACVHVSNGILKFSVQGPGSPNALTITQFFDRGNISAVGWAACDGPQACTSTQYISSWTAAQWGSAMQLSGNAGIDGLGLRLTSGSQQLGSGFRSQKVLLADNWETSFEIWWDYGGFTATGIGEGITMVFHDMATGAGFINNGYYGYYGNNPRSFGLIFVADHVRGCPVNCEEVMRIVQNGVANPNAPTGSDPERSQFVWGPASWTKVTIKYNYDTKFMYIYVGSQLYLVWTVDVMSSGFADANGYGWVGFTARTANFYQGTFRVINWDWTRYKVAQDKIRIDGGDGLRVGYAGPQAITFNLDTRDSCNYAVYSNMQTSPALLVMLTGRGSIAGVTVNASSLSPVAAFPGLLRVTVFASQAGFYDVHVQCNDAACAGTSGYSTIGYLEIAPSF